MENRRITINTSKTIEKKLIILSRVPPMGDREPGTGGFLADMIFLTSELSMVCTFSPREKSSILPPRPPATPRSASEASPGPLTSQPMTATVMLIFIPSSFFLKSTVREQLPGMGIPYSKRPRQGMGPGPGDKKILRKAEPARQQPFHPVPFGTGGGYGPAPLLPRSHGKRRDGGMGVC